MHIVPTKRKRKRKRPHATATEWMMKSRRANTEHAMQYIETTLSQNDLDYHISQDVDLSEIITPQILSLMDNTTQHHLRRSIYRRIKTFKTHYPEVYQYSSWTAHMHHRQQNIRIYSILESFAFLYKHRITVPLLWAKVNTRWYAIYGHITEFRRRGGTRQMHILDMYCKRTYVFQQRVRGFTPRDRRCSLVVQYESKLPPPIGVFHTFYSKDVIWWVTVVKYLQRYCRITYCLGNIVLQYIIERSQPGESHYTRYI